MSNEVKALKSGIWYVMATFLVRGIGFITTPIFTRLLTKEQYGLLANYTSWESILSIIVTLNLTSTLISGKYDYKDNFDSYIYSAMTLSVFSAAFWLVATNLCGNFISDLLKVDGLYLNIMLVYLMLVPIVHLYQARERYNFEYKKTVLISVVLTLSSAIVSIFLVYYMENRLTGRIIGSSLPAIVIGLGIFLHYFKKFKLGFSLKHWKYALKICLPYIPHSFSLILLNSMDKVMITRVCGPEKTALYSLAYSVAAIVTIFLGALNNAFAPWLGDKLANKEYDRIRYFAPKYITFFYFLVIGIILVAPEVLHILGGQPYMAALGVMCPVMLGCMCQFLYTMFVNVEQFSKKTVGMAIATILAAMMNYVLNNYYIPKYGYIAAAYTTFVSYLFLLFEHMFLVYKIKLNVVYSYRFVGFSVLVACLFAFIGSSLYSINSLRYTFMGLYMLLSILVVCKYKSQIMQFVRNKKV